MHRSYRLLHMDSISMTSPGDALALLRTWLRTERQRVSWPQRRLQRRDRPRDRFAERGVRRLGVARVHAAPGVAGDRVRDVRRHARLVHQRNERRPQRVEACASVPALQDAAGSERAPDGLCRIAPRTVGEEAISAIRLGHPTLDAGGGRADKRDAKRRTSRRIRISPRR